LRAPRPKREPRVEEEQGYAPTPETVAKLRTDLVLRLHRQGRLTIEQFQAAEEIRRVWQAVGRGLFPTAGTLDGVARAAPGQPRHPIDRMTDSEERAFRRRYRPWAREMDSAMFCQRRASNNGGGRGVSYLQLVYDMVIDNHGPRQVERLHRLRHGLAVKGLRTALQRYAELAQWLRPERHGAVLVPQGVSSAVEQLF
jgi:hypothetical protein